MKKQSLKKIKLSLLIIEDNVQLNSLFCEILDEEFNIHTAFSAVEAFNILKKVNIDLILCDHHLPDINGIDFLIQINNLYPRIINTVITGNNCEKLILKSHNSRIIFQFLLKPIFSQDLKEKMKLSENAWHILRKSEEHAQELEKFRAISESPDLINNFYKYKLNKYLTNFVVIFKIFINIIATILILAIIALFIIYSIKTTLGIDLFH